MTVQFSYKEILLNLIDLIDNYKDIGYDEILIDIQLLADQIFGKFIDIETLYQQCVDELNDLYNYSDYDYYDD